IGECEGFGCNVEGIKERLKIAKINLAKAEYKMTHSELLSLIDECERIKGELANTKMGEIEGLLEIGKEVGIDSLKFLSHIDEIKKNIESEEYSSALRKSNDAFVEIEKAINEAVEKEIDAVKNEIERGLKLGFDASIPKDELEKAKIALEKDYYLEAHAHAKNSKDICDNEIRKVVRSELEKIEKIITIAKSVGADVSYVDEIFKFALDSLEKSFYEDAIAKSRNGVEVCKNKCFEAIGDAIKSCETTIEETGELGCDIEELKNLIEEAKRKNEEEMYEEAKTITETIINKCKEKGKEEAEKNVAILNEIIEIGEDIGTDVETGKKFLEKATNAFEKNKIKEVIKNCKKGVEEVEKAISSDIKDFFATIESAIDTIEKIGCDASKIKEIFKTVGEELEKKDYRKCWHVLTKILDECELTKGNFVKGEVEKAEKEIENAKDFGANISDARNVLNKAKEEIEKGSYDSAHKLTKECSSLVDDALKKFVETSFSSLKDRLKEIEEKGVELTALWKSIETVEEKIKNKEYRDCMEIIQSGMNEAETRLSEFEDANTFLKYFEEEIAVGKRIGVELSIFEEKMNEANENMAHHEYLNAIKLAKEGRKKLREAIIRYSEDEISKVSELMKKVRESGVKIAECVSYMDEGKIAFEERRYEDAIKLAKDCEACVNKRKEEYDNANKALDELSKEIKNLVELGIDKSIIEERIIEANKKIDEGEYLIAIEELVNGREEAEILERNKVEEKLENCKMMINNGIALGANIAVAKELYEECKKELACGNYIVAMEIGDGCEAEVDRAIKEHNELKAVIEKFASMISETKEKGVNVNKILVMKESMEELLKEHMYEEIKTTFTEGEEKLKQLQERYEKTKEKISGVEARCILYKKIGLDLSAIEGIISASRNALKEGKYEDVDTLAVEIESTLLKLLDENIMDAVKKTEKYISDLEEDGIAVDDAMENLLSAIEMHKEKRYDEAHSKISNARDIAENRKNAYKSALEKINSAKFEAT
ncbi:MAG: hypothetical protein AB1779_10315, partial [Candidatus Thermoplasmatota archaeon]